MTNRANVNSNEKKRFNLNEYQIINVILSFLVIYGHIQSQAVEQYKRDSLLFFIVYTLAKILVFIVPAFIFMSGFKIMMYKSNNFKYGQFIKRRILKIYLPYVIAATIYYFYFVFRGFVNIGFGIWLEQILLGTVAAPFYFIPTIMQFYLLAPLWIKLYKRVELCFLLSLIVTLLFKFALPIFYELYIPENTFVRWLVVQNDRIFLSYVVYWMFGALWGKYHIRICRALSNRRIAIIAAVYAALMPLHIYFSYQNIKGVSLYYVAEAANIFICLMNILLLFTIVRKVWARLGDRINHTLSLVISYIDGITFDIYLWHCIFIYILDERLHYLGITSVSQRLVIRLVFVYVISVIFCLFLKQLKYVMSVLFSLSLKQIKKVRKIRFWKISSTSTAPKPRND